MAAYVYFKKPPKRKTRFACKERALASLFLGSGFFFLGIVVWPILTFENVVAPKLVNNIVSPIPDEKVLGTQADLTYISNWFPTATQRTGPSKITSYSLSVPKLGIKDAAVVIGSEDLSRNLIQWGGSALPGEYGNAVVFGHSVLKVFFNPKNYMTIFSTLGDLTEKDEIIVYFDGITYTYQVSEMKVVDPMDISVLEQKYDDSYISLITCVPPGTYWKRLVVKARLVKI